MFVLLYFALTLFTSATLLFFVQPMVGKMILPRLGGTPAVWNTCMVFFQAVLLLGYGYTHFVSHYLSRRRQLILQAILLLTPLLFLPFALGSWTPPEDSNPVFSVLWILTLMVGVPFFVVSTSAPLLQKWFAFTEHPAAKDPYFLYGASNLGSMLALVLYPVAMEPNLGLREQTLIWTAGYGIFVVFVLGCIAILWSRARPQSEADWSPAPTVASETAIAAGPPKRSKVLMPREADADDVPTWPRRLRWIGLAAVPSSLMLGTTTYMTTDIAAIPFFWVLPLALYLMTFILVFSRWPVVWTASNEGKPCGPRWLAFAAIVAMGALVLGAFGLQRLYEEYADFLELGVPHLMFALAFVAFFVYWIASGTGGPHDFVLYFQPCFLLFLVLKFVAQLAPPTWLEFGLHLLSFLFVTLMCHGELAKDRPSARHLTEFYLWMSVGGVLGGLFNALVAPTVFRIALIEYPLAMILSCFLRPNLVGDATLFPGDSKKGESTPLSWALNLLVPLAIAGIGYLCVTIDNDYGPLNFLRRDIDRYLRNFLMALPVILVLALAMRPLRFGVALGMLWLVVGIHDENDQKYVFRDRGFFGMVKVRERGDSGTQATYHTLIHGGIDHGRQHIDPRRHHEPCAYFHPLTPIGQLFMKFTWPNTPLPRSLAEFEQKRNPYFNFALPNGRFPAALAGVASDPLATLVALHSEPPYAVVGLGTGTLAAFAKPYQPVDIYEIDPLVYRLSQRVEGKDPPFTYLLDAQKRGANLKVILGDGRLKIEKAPELWYHIICLDAFSSDAIPVHLLTVEAVELYLRKLAPGGVMVFNATNRYVEIAGVLKDIADHLGLECLYLQDWYTDIIPEKYGTDFVFLRRKQETIDALRGPFNGMPPLTQRLDTENWKELMANVKDEGARKGKNVSWDEWQAPRNLGGRLWTDSYSNLLGVLRFRH